MMDGEVTPVLLDRGMLEFVEFRDKVGVDFVSPAETS